MTSANKLKHRRRAAISAVRRPPPFIPFVPIRDGFGERFSGITTIFRPNGGFFAINDKSDPGGIACTSYFDAAEQGQAFGSWHRDTLRMLMTANVLNCIVPRIYAAASVAVRYGPFSGALPEHAGGMWFQLVFNDGSEKPLSVVLPQSCFDLDLDREELHVKDMTVRIYSEKGEVARFAATIRRVADIAECTMRNTTTSLANPTSADQLLDGELLCDIWYSHEPLDDAVRSLVHQARVFSGQQFDGDYDDLKSKMLELAWSLCGFRGKNGGQGGQPTLSRDELIAFDYADVPDSYLAAFIEDGRIPLEADLAFKGPLAGIAWRRAKVSAPSK